MRSVYVHTHTYTYIPESRSLRLTSFKVLFVPVGSHHSNPNRRRSSCLTARDQARRAREREMYSSAGFSPRGEDTIVERGTNTSVAMAWLSRMGIKSARVLLRLRSRSFL